MVVTLKKISIRGAKFQFRAKQYCGFCIFNTEVAPNIGANMKRFGVISGSWAAGEIPPGLHESLWSVSPNLHWAVL